MTRRGRRSERARGAARPQRAYAIRANLEAFVVLTIVALAAWAVARADAEPDSARTVYATGRIVPIPASIPHEEGDMVDRRILRDLRWISRRFHIYITDGYSGPLPAGGRAGCRRCHTRHSDHYNGLAVDIVPDGGGTRCDRSWRSISRLAHWAEPRRNKPRPPFRWVGYNGDRGHGCGHHLHLSWNHAAAPEYRLAEWVEVLPGHLGNGSPLPTGQAPATIPPGSKPEKSPTGGISQARTGGLAPRRD